MSDLVYHIHDGSDTFRFQLSGDLAGVGVREVEQTWRTASSVIGDRGLVVDVSSVTSVDPSGRELLSRWQESGARIIVTSIAAKQQIESMMNLPVTLAATVPEPSPWLPFRLSQLLFSHR